MSFSACNKYWDRFLLIRWFWPVHRSPESQIVGGHFCPPALCAAEQKHRIFLCTKSTIWTVNLPFSSNEVEDLFAWSTKEFQSLVIVEPVGRPQPFSGTRPRTLYSLEIEDEFSCFYAPATGSSTQERGSQDLEVMFVAKVHH